jgi:transposase-like protein
MNHHLGYPSGAARPANTTNQRNGKGTAKTVLTEDGPIRIEVPRDRDGSFEPLLILKHEPFFAFPPGLRKVIYTTNAIENINAQLRKIIKTRGHFPSDDAATQLFWLALRNITADWGRAAHDWKTAMNQSLSFARIDSFDQRCDS